MQDNNQQSEIKTKTLAWVITTLYLTVGLTGIILIALISVALALILAPLDLKLPEIAVSAITLLVSLVGYILAFKVGVDFVLKRTVVKKKYFNIIIFCLLALIALVQVWRGGLELESILGSVILLMALYFFGAFYFKTKAQKQLASLQISDEQLPELKIITVLEAIIIIILIAVISGAVMMRGSLLEPEEAEDGTKQEETIPSQLEETIPLQFPKTGEKLEQYETANWRTHRNEEYGFEVKYPIDWSTDEQEPKLYTEQDSFTLTIEDKKISENPRVKVALNSAGIGYEFLKRTKTESMVIGEQTVEFIYAQSVEDFLFGCGERGVKTFRGFLDGNLNQYGHRDSWLFWGIFCQGGEDYTMILEQMLSTFKFID